MFVLLHRHGEARPKGRASYMKFGEFKNKNQAIRRAKDLELDGARYTPKSKVAKTKHPKLFYIKK